MATFYYQAGDETRCVVACPFIGCGASMLTKAIEDAHTLTLIGSCNRCGHVFCLGLSKNDGDDYVAIDEDLT